MEDVLCFVIIWRIEFIGEYISRGDFDPWVFVVEFGVYLPGFAFDKADICDDRNGLVP